MNYYIDKMENSLSDEDKFFLKNIYAPFEVAVPPSDASRNMCVSPLGEIRIYGGINRKEPKDAGTGVYISSNDCGLSWKTHIMPERCLGAAAVNPDTGRYITTFPNEYRPEIGKYFNKTGTWAILNNGGFDSTENRFVRLSEKRIHILKNPYYFKNIERWLIVGEHLSDDCTTRHVVVFFSDDDGESWIENFIEKTAPRFEITPPHKGLRWQQDSCEPTIAQLSDGKLIMLVRTSLNYHYYYRSDNGGETWDGPYPTSLHSTITMPVLENLSDGRIVTFWCNTQPLPELDHTKAFPPLPDDIINGIWEDVFTNRDANHLAISEDDMNSFIGFRELSLNAVRNNSDFRSIGDSSTLDKSVHQAQIIELPYNKLLIHFGQNSISRRVVILDINWLYEKERSENFRFGLKNVSTQMYVKSNLGCFNGFSGHCAYNRTNGALLVPDPSGSNREALQVCRVEDERLVFKKQGVVWNFPASHKGRIEIEMEVLGSGVGISLTDHWYNPCDETVASEACYYFEVSQKSDWFNVCIEYDTQMGSAYIVLNNKKQYVNARSLAPNGLCYLHIQTLAQSEDFKGTLIKSFKKTEIQQYNPEPSSH